MITETEKSPKVDPAPALRRGLRIIQLLSKDGMSTLGQLSEATGWPKSSVLRLLRSLEMMQFVEREDGGRRYRGLVQIMPVNGEVAVLKQAAVTSMQKLCRTVGHTVELHYFNRQHLELVERIEPLDTEVTVRMRIGYQREQQEIDALMQVACAYGLGTDILKSQQSWVWTDAKQIEITVDRAEQLINLAKANEYGIDCGYNYGGVMRLGIPLFRTNRTLIGVLAIAQVCHPTMRQLDQAMIRNIKNAGSIINTNLINGHLS
ncbi:helix-turn-helix domain-containing protein [Planctomycetota bacterium]|nr:helix-turn-helix domain-containing protein [Planctomycetota bacterium]